MLKIQNCLTDDGTTIHSTVTTDILVDEIRRLILRDVVRVAILVDGKGEGASVYRLTRLGELVLDLLRAPIALEASPSVVVTTPGDGFCSAVEGVGGVCIGGSFIR